MPKLEYENGQVIGMNGYRIGDIIALQGYGETIRNYPFNHKVVSQQEFEIERILIEPFTGWVFQLKGFKKHTFRIQDIRYVRRP